MWEKREAPLGIFDSGVGGLTVVREILKQMPHESILYYADTAHVPYGSRNPQELKGFARKITSYLVTRQCKMIVIACNTSTSLAYEELQNLFSPIIGVIEPGVEKALKITKNLRIGVIGICPRLIVGFIKENCRLKILLFKYCSALFPFVPLVEKGITTGVNIEKTVARCLQPLLEKNIDTLILGCTHYPFLQPVIAKVMGSQVKIIDPAYETVRQAYEILKELNLLATGQNPVYNYVSSKNPADFRARGSVFLGRDLGTVKEIHL